MPWLEKRGAIRVGAEGSSAERTCRANDTLLLDWGSYAASQMSSQTGC
jgi:hypothetical protein